MYPQPVVEEYEMVSINTIQINTTGTSTRPPVESTIIKWRERKRRKKGRRERGLKVQG